MDGVRLLASRYLPALTLGLAAAAALLVPPFKLATRLDRTLQDSWTRISPPAAPEDLALLELNDAAWLATLVTLAEHAGARVIVTTLPQPPSPKVNFAAYGPTELPLGDRVLRRTEWMHGGHLWFRAELDGIVRQDFAVIDDHAPIPSLAAAAARAIGAEFEHASAIDDSGRHWLRFHDPASFEHLEPGDLLADQSRLAGKIVVAGRGEKDYLTPLGPMSASELIAQAMADRLSGSAVQAGPYAMAAAWALALVLLAGLLLGAAWPTGPRLLGLAGASGLLVAASSGAFLYLGLLLPVAAPAAFLLVAGGIALSAPRRAAEPGRQDEPSPVEARRLVAAGDLVGAARVYRALPPSVALLPELYELAGTLEQDGQHEQAADLFHRIAQTDIRFRDVANRIAATAKSLTHTGNDVAPPLTELPTTLGRYELLEIIGYGTTGQVYLGRDPKINRLLAIKAISLRAEGAQDTGPQANEHFLREVESAGRLSHPNIVTIYDVGETQGLAYIAMEYLKGRHLSHFTDPERLLPIPLLLELLARAAHALHYAHTQNVIHRDIKPANIMYDSVSDELKITDFGIARLVDVNRTRTGIILGTPSFMAPEQIEGENVNGYTDLFALGVTLYQLLTGRLPFRGASMTKLMFVIANEPHQPVTALRPGLPDALSAILDRTLAKEPRDRFATGAEMADALRAVAASMI